MTELFDDLPVETKKQISTFVDIVISSLDLPRAAAAIAEFCRGCSDRESEFLEFYLDLLKEWR